MSIKDYKKGPYGIEDIVERLESSPVTGTAPNEARTNVQNDERYAQDDDSRLSNAREWSAATISQAEAEAGTASTRRAFTAQRVRQALNAWWQLVTSGFGRNFIAANSEQAARNVLQLGTAATANLTTSTTGGTSGQVLMVGDFGLGSIGSQPPWPNTDLGNCEGVRAGIYRAIAYNTGMPPGVGTENIVKYALRNTNDNGIQITQEIISARSGRVLVRVASDADPASPNFSDWIEYISTVNLLQATGSSTYFPMSQAATTNQLDTKANTSTQVIAGTGLTGGGDLTANRTISVNYGTAAGTAAQGNDSRIVNAVPNSRTITAGTGLTGGGTLAANRTLTVSYGTTAGTAAQGNDSRVVNALQKGNNLSDVSNKTTARSNLDLGTAATRNVGTEGGNVMQVGAFGLGGEPEDLGNSTADEAPLGSVTRFNTRSSESIAKGLPDVGVGATATQWWNLFTFGTSNRKTQIASEVFGSGGGSYKGRIFTRVKHDANWTDWVEMQHTGNILQATGSSTDFPMSQKAVTDQLATLGTAATANLTTSDTDVTAGRVLRAGAFGLGNIAQQPNWPNTDLVNCEGVASGVYRAIASTTGLPAGVSTTSIVKYALRNTTTGWQVTQELINVFNGRSFLRVASGDAPASSPNFTDWIEYLTTGNTTLNPDGTLKASSPVIDLYTDKHELHSETQFGATPAVTRKSKGVYEITGTLGLRSEGWYLDTPSDRNGNKYFNIEWTQNITPDAADSVVDEYRDDIVVTIETFERVWNKDTGLFENGAPMDINDLQARFVQLRFNEIKVELEELDDEAITRNQE